MEALIEKLQDKVHKAVKKWPFAPVMMCYASDGWSAKVKDKTGVDADPDNQIKHQQGVCRAEFALERAFVLQQGQHADSFFGLRSKIRRLLDGKGASNFFRCFQQFSRSLRRMGAGGIVIQSFCFDKALFSSMMRLARGHYATAFAQIGDGLHEASHEQLLEYCMEWCVGLSCRDHGCSKAVEWAVKPFGDKDIRDNAHIAIKSLINCSYDIHRSVEAFTTAKVGFHDRPHSETDVRKWWTFLRMPEKLMELFVLCDLHWDGGQLLVSRRVFATREPLQQVQHVVHVVCHWENWSETR